MNDWIKHIRKHYIKNQLLETEIASDPFQHFQTWLKDAIDGEDEYATAMVLSTISKENMPCSRVVLLKDISHEGFTFFTNYESKKADNLRNNSNASLLFFWKELERQVRIEGHIMYIPESESISYFNERPRESQLTTWASNQSKVIPSRKVLETRYAYYTNLYDRKDVPKPPHWGGYVLVPEMIEFWQGRANRLHDRLQFTKKDKEWKLERLAP